MFSLEAFEITIGSFKLKRINEVRIESSWKNMTDTCTIKIPRNIKLGGKKLTDLIKVGDAVTVKLGYDGQLREEFKGYLTHIKSTTPVELQCEDEMWQLKKGSYTQSWSNASLDDVLKAVMGNRQYETLGSITLGKFTINKATPAKVLEEINKTYGLKSFFRKGVLMVGKVYAAGVPKHSLNFQRNVVSNNLEYRSAEEVKIKVNAISIQKDGKKLEKQLGDSDGEERTLHYFGITNVKDLEDKAKIQMSLLKFDGYRGTVVTFGTPNIEHGDIVKLQGSNTMLSIGETPVNDHDGEYYVDKVVKSFSITGGLRRESEVGVTVNKALTNV